MSKKRTQVTIPEPYENAHSLRVSLLAAKELIEMLAGQRGEVADHAVTWDDMVKLGIIKPEQVPPELGIYRARR
jgi:hypothetical protein